MNRNGQMFFTSLASILFACAGTTLATPASRMVIVTGDSIQTGAGPSGLTEQISSVLIDANLNAMFLARYGQTAACGSSTPDPITGLVYSPFGGSSEALVEYMDPEFDFNLLGFAYEESGSGQYSILHRVACPPVAGFSSYWVWKAGVASSTSPAPATVQTLLTSTLNSPPCSGLESSETICWGWNNASQPSYSHNPVQGSIGVRSELNLAGYPILVSAAGSGRAYAQTDVTDYVSSGQCSLTSGCASLGSNVPEPSSSASLVWKQNLFADGQLDGSPSAVQGGASNNDAPDLGSTGQAPGFTNPNNSISQDPLFCVAPFIVSSNDQGDTLVNALLNVGSSSPNPGISFGFVTRSDALWHVDAGGQKTLIVTPKSDLGAGRTGEGFLDMFEETVSWSSRSAGGNDGDIQLPAAGLNENGDVVFRTKYSEPDGMGGSINHVGLFLWDHSSGNYQLLAKEGDIISYQGVDFEVTELLSMDHPSNRVAYVGDRAVVRVKLDPQGVWSPSVPAGILAVDTSGATPQAELVVVQGGVTDDGCPTGTGRIPSNFDDMRSVAVSPEGRIVFTEGQDVRVWAENQNGRFELVASTGAMVNFDDGSSREVSTIRGILRGSGSNGSGTSVLAHPASGNTVVGLGVSFSSGDQGVLLVELVDQKADINLDGTVGGDDLSQLLAAWGSSSCPEDIDGDGTVGGGDLAALLAVWGPVPFSAVP